MINGAARPWGKFNWLLTSPTLKSKKWFLLGSVSTQDRCQALLLHHGVSIELSSCGLLEIEDAESVFSVRSKAQLDRNRQAVSPLLPANSEIAAFGLFAPLVPVRRKVVEWIERSGGNIVFDISSLPERYSFPILRWLVESPVVKNLLLAYMLPEQYTKEDLGYDSLDWGPLPTFLNDEKSNAEQVIVGVGFLPYSLPDWLKKTYNTPNFKISLLMPFPAAPENVNRSWEFIRRIESDLSLRDDRQIVRVAAHDLWASYQRIDMLTRGGAVAAVFAPYGPKAHSMAMGLHALRHASEVYFTQPSYYHPEYSSGMRADSGMPAGFAYVVRLNGKDVF